MDGPQHAARPLTVWTVCDGEPMPIDPGQPRLLRMAILSQLLAARGHKVVYWTSRFDHLRKATRLDAPGRVGSGQGYAIHCTDCVPYSANVSLARLRHNRVVRRGAETAMRADPDRPDIIVADLPTLELADLAAGLGCEWGVPVAISIRDLWPDVYYTVLPGPLQRLGPLIFARWNRLARRALRRATSLVGISRGYLDWALANAGRAGGENDAIIPLGYPSRPAVDPDAEVAAWAALTGRGVDPEKRLVCFVGTFGRSYDLGTVIEAARTLETTAPDVQFVLCGDGERAAGWRAAAAGLNNVVFPGWVDKWEIAVLLDRATLGLAAYAAGVKQGLPNKFFEYMSFGLPIVSALEGEAREELECHGFGASYRAGQGGDLADVITNLVTDPDRLARMARAAQDRFEDRYRQARVYERYVALVEGLAAKTGGPAANAYGQTAVGALTDKGPEPGRRV